MKHSRLLLLLPFFICLLKSTPVLAEPTQICDFRCVNNPRYAKVSCAGQLLHCVPDPCCQSETRHLDMSNNELTHLKVLAFQSYPKLRFLDLRQNAVTNIAPGAFSNLDQLQLLDLRANKMRHLFAGMFNGLTTLKKLYLANNLIESIAPGTFIGMTNLISLKLNYNRLNILQNNMFLPLQSLQRLYIYGNQITNIHDQAFRGLVKLVTLSLAENPLVTFPNILPFLPEITHIRLHNTPLRCDCKLEFLRAWLRENLYDAYESYAICSQPHHLHNTPLYRVMEPLLCTAREGNLPVSREVNHHTHISQFESVDSRDLTPSTTYSESESDYSEASESFSDISHEPVSRTSTASNEGNIIGQGGPGVDTSRPEPEAPAVTLAGHEPLEPLTPRGTISPVGFTTQRVTAPTGGSASAGRGVTHFTPPTLTQPLRRENPGDTLPESPGGNTSNSGPSVNGSFNELPRPPPRSGSRNDGSWFEGERGGSQHGSRDDTTLTTTTTTTASYMSTKSFRSSDADTPHQGPPQSWGLRGSSVTIDCPVHIHNFNESKIKWLTPHGKLVVSNVSRYGIAKRGSLVIHNLRAYDHGTYRCIVRTAMNSVKMLPARLILACPCNEIPKQPSFEPSTNSTSSRPHYIPGSEHHDVPPYPHDPGCSPVPMVVAIVTTFQATVALCVITFCLCCSKNLNHAFKERACTGVPEPISVVPPPGKFNARTRDFARSSEPTSSSSALSSRESEFYEALTDHGFAPRQASSIRSYNTYYESHPQSEYVNYRKPKNYMYMIGYMDTANGRRAIGYRSSSECASIKEISNENIYVSKD